MYARLAWDSPSKQILLFTTFSFLPLSPIGFLKAPQFFTVAGKVRASARQGQEWEELFVCLGYLEVGCWEEQLWYILLTLPFRKFLPYGPLLPSNSLPSLSLSSLSLLLCMCLLLPSGREPSISSDTRTDSSTESYPYKHSHHESVVSHFSSDSQGTVIYNVENDSTSQSSRDTGRELYSGRCLPDSVPTQRFSQGKETGASQKCQSWKGRKAQNLGN